MALRATRTECAISIDGGRLQAPTLTYFRRKARRRRCGGINPFAHWRELSSEAVAVRASLRASLGMSLVSLRKLWTEPARWSLFQASFDRPQPKTVEL